MVYDIWGFDVQAWVIRYAVESSSVQFSCICLPVLVAPAWAFDRKYLPGLISDVLSLLFANCLSRVCGGPWDMSG